MTTVASDAVIHRVGRRFPLVARSRVACGSLEERLTEIGDLAAHDSPGGSLDAADGSGVEREALTAVAYNKAALLASDGGLPELARQLCWIHHHRYSARTPWTHHRARLALEPLVNLARLHQRAGDADRAIDVLTALGNAVRTGAPTPVDGREVTFALDDDRQALIGSTWAIVLADGVRALCAAGRWDDAARFAAELRGVGDRLLDGRQALILDHALLRADPDTATDLIDTSSIDQPWEQILGLALRVTVRRAAPRALATAARTERDLVERYLALETTPGLAVFATRLGLVALDLVDDPDRATGRRLLQRLVHLARTSSDATVARDLLDHPALAAATTLEDREHLTASLRAAGFGPYAPADLEQRLIAALRRAR